MRTKTGILDGKAATTHWAMTEHFSAQFPPVNLQPDRMVVDEGDVITCTKRRAESSAAATACPPAPREGGEQ